MSSGGEGEDGGGDEGAAGDTGLGGTVGGVVGGADGGGAIATTTFSTFERLGVAATVTPATASDSVASWEVEKLRPSVWIVARAAAAVGNVISATMSTDAEEKERVTHAGATSAAAATSCWI